MANRFWLYLVGLIISLGLVAFWNWERIDLAAQAVVLLVNLLLQSIHCRAHLVGIVGSLFDEVLQDTEPSVEGGLQALHHVEQLLDLGLQRDDFL